MNRFANWARVLSSAVLLAALLASSLGSGSPIQADTAEVATPELAPPLTPYLVKDINQNTGDAASSGCAITAGALGNITFFAANDGITGCALWKSDGTDVGTSLVKDITSSPYNELIHNFFALSGTLYFAANDDVHGYEVWRTDGTTAGTQLVADIAPGATSALAEEFVSNEYERLSFASLGGTLFFAADDGVNGKELWKSDGTAAGTALVKDVRAGDAASSPYNLVVMNNTLYFFAYDGQTYGLWMSDGTADGTARVAEFYPNKNGLPYWPPPDELTVVSNTLFFKGLEAQYSYRLWKSDGTSAGTQLVIPTDPATTPNVAQALTGFGNDIYFWADNGLWRSDGSASDTKRLFVRSGSYLNQLKVSGNALYFFADDNLHGVELMKTDGTITGTVLVKDIQPGAQSGIYTELKGSGNGLLFFGDYTINTNLFDSKLWATDGTTTGTVLLKTGMYGSLWVVPATNTAFAMFNTPQRGVELWKSAGTPAGTVLVKDINLTTANSSPSQFTAFNGKLFFAANDDLLGRRLWQSDGTLTGTIPIENITISSTQSVGPGELTVIGNALYLVAPNTPATATTQIYQLWRTDGSPTGAVQLSNSDLGVGELFCYRFSCQYQSPFITGLGNEIVFAGRDSIHGAELWKSSGTPTSTVLLKDIVPGVGSSGLRSFAQMGSRLFFQAFDSSFHRSLWVTDGTSDGTQLVKSFVVMDESQFAIGSSLFFAGHDSDEYYASLWKTDGTPAGTVLFRTIAPQFPQVNTSLMGSVNGVLVAFNSDGSLWRTDGTAAGTFQLASYPPNNYTAFRKVIGNHLFFGSSSSDMPFSLIITDGSVTGTKVLRDFSDYLAPSYLTAFGNSFIFIKQSNYVDELWTTDGTSAGTRKVSTLPNFGYSYHFYYKDEFQLLISNTLYLSAYNQATGNELWAISFSNRPDPHLNVPASWPIPAAIPAWVPVEITNFGVAPVTPALSATLTATLGLSLTYVSDTSGITPTVQGNTVVWRLPSIGVLQQKNFVVQASSPNAAVGQRYPITFTLGSLSSASEAKTVEIVVGHGVYLPTVFR